MNIGTAATTCRVTLVVKPVGKGGRADVRPVSSLSVALEPGGTVQWRVTCPGNACFAIDSTGCVSDTDASDIRPWNECTPVRVKTR